MRTTRKGLEHALDITATELACLAGGQTAGFLKIETWSPGDGKTRYRLMYRDHEGIEWECGPYQGRAAMLDTLGTLRAIACRIISSKRRLRSKLDDMVA